MTVGMILDATIPRCWHRQGQALLLGVPFRKQRGYVLRLIGVGHAPGTVSHRRSPDLHDVRGVMIDCEGYPVIPGEIPCFLAVTAAEEEDIQPGVGITYRRRLGLAIRP